MSVENFTTLLVNKQYSEAKALLMEDPTLINALNKDGFAAIHVVACEDDAAVLNILIGNGCDINLKTAGLQTALQESYMR